MYRVLVPVDLNEDRALSQAEYVASLPNAADTVEAIILFVFEGDTSDDLPDDMDQFDRSVLRIGSVMHTREYLTDRGVSVHVLEDSVEAVAKILAVAETRDVDAIVMGGRKQSLPEKALFGSVTEAVIRQSNRPVVVTGGNSD